MCVQISLFTCTCTFLMSVFLYLFKFLSTLALYIIICTTGIFDFTSPMHESIPFVHGQPIHQQSFALSLSFLLCYMYFCCGQKFTSSMHESIPFVHGQPIHQSFALSLSFLLHVLLLWSEV